MSQDKQKKKINEVAKSPEKKEYSDKEKSTEAKRNSEKKLSLKKRKKLAEKIKKERKKLSKSLGEDLNNLNSNQIKEKISTLSVDKLREAELNVEGTGLHLFAHLTEDDKPKLVPYGRKLQKDEKIVIDFLDNEEAENHYGMRTLFKHNPEIRKVKIKHSSPRGRGRDGIAVRHSWNGNFYFESGPHEGKYAPIFSGTEVEIVHIWSKEEAEKEKTALVARRHKERTSAGSRQTAEQTQRARQRQVEGRSINRAQHQHERMHEQMGEKIQNFQEKWNEIQTNNTPQRLIDMVKEINMHPEDPIIKVPDEPRNITLRSGAALRYALFKRYAELKGYKVLITSGYRSVEQQRRIWNEGLKRRRAKLALRHPNKSIKEINRLAEQANRQFIAKPGGSHHNTGGAIDIRIYDRNDNKISMHKYRGTKRAYDQALKTGDLTRLSRRDRQAVETRLFMDRRLMASHFLGQNYYRETWHWELDRKQVYSNI